MIISTSEEITIGEVACLIAAEFDYEHRVKSNSNYSDGQYKKTATSSELAEYFPNFEFTDLTQGLKNVVEYFTTNYRIIRK